MIAYIKQSIFNTTILWIVNNTWRMHLQTLFEYRQAWLGITVFVVMALICVGGIKYVPFPEYVH